MLFNPKDSSEKIILFNQPLIINEKLFEKTYSISQTKGKNGYSFVEFTYSVFGHKFSRYQMIEESQVVCNECKYLVKYNIKNPKIAYIFLDSLIAK
jgi:hypothetical protein